MRCDHFQADQSTSTVINMELRSRKVIENLDGHTEEEEEDEEVEALLAQEDSESCEVKVKKGSSKFGGDGQNIAVLLFLYVLQGIPLGLAAAVPLILTNRQVSYR